MEGGEDRGGGVWQGTVANQSLARSMLREGLIMHRLSTTSRQVDVTQVRLLACVQVRASIHRRCRPICAQVPELMAVPSLFSDLKTAVQVLLLCCAALL